jgi:hypothetical protein
LKIDLADDPAEQQTKLCLNPPTLNFRSRYILVNRQLLVSLVYAIFFTAPISGNAGQLAPVQFGLAEGNGSSGCVAFDDLDIREGEPITLVTVTGLSEQQRVLMGTVGTKLISPSPCSGLENSHFHGYIFSVSLSRGSFNVENLAIAISESTSLKVIIEGESAGLSTSGSPTLYFRSCATGEGLFLTAWAGKPLEGKRLWSKYYYLGYDVDPNCTELDFDRRSRIIEDHK